VPRHCHVCRCHNNFPYAADRSSHHNNLPLDENSSDRQKKSVVKAISASPTRFSHIVKVNSEAASLVSNQAVEPQVTAIFPSALFRLNSEDTYN